MPLNPAFEHNGISFIMSSAPAPMGPPGENVVAWVVTAPDKHASIEHSVPFRVSNEAQAALLDTTGNERGTAWHAAIETMKKTSVPQYFIIVPEGVNEAATITNIIGGVQPATGRRLGISALSECLEKPTIIAAPGFSKNKAVIDALAAMAKRLRCRVVVDGPGTTTADAIALSTSLGGVGTGYDRVYLVDPLPSIYSKKAQGKIYVPPSTVAVGAVAAVKPWESPGNQGVMINDTSRSIEYNILDKDTEGSLLNKNGISYFGKTSLGGFSLIGNRTVTGAFLSHIGLEDAIARKLESASQVAMSKQMTGNFWEQEVKKIDLFVQDLVAAGILPGGSVYLHPTLNSVERYKNGSWYVVIDYGRYSPNEHMIFHVNAADKYVEQFIEGAL